MEVYTRELRLEHTTRWTKMSRKQRRGGDKKKKERKRGNETQVYTPEWNRWKHKITENDDKGKT